MSFKTSTKSAVTPISALTLLQEERDRKQTKPPCCLLQHPGLALPLGITQLAGPAGTGKTQIALTLLCDCVLRKKNQKAVFISLGGSSAVLGRTSKRLQTMLASRLKNTNMNTNTNIQQHYLTRIYIHRVRNSEDLLDLLQNSLPRLLKLNPTISMVVLDSIASLFRIQDENIPNPWQHRSTMFFQISSRCKALSSAYQIPFLVINEATTKIPNTNTNTDNNASFSSSNNHQRLQPALGLSWSQCVNSTFFVTRGTTTTAQSPPEANQPTTTMPVIRRLLRCIKSPRVPANATVEFYIDCRGTVRIK